MKFVSISLSILASMVPNAFATDECKTVEVQQNFDYDTYSSKPWYIQMQMVTDFNPPSSLFCIRARFRTRTEPKNGYPVGVITEKREGSVTGELVPTDQCVYNPDPSEPAKLALAPCQVPKDFAGPYWIVRHNEREGYAIISAGQPTVPSGKGDGLCKTASIGFNNSGIWIFTRKQERDEELVQKAMKDAEGVGIDISIFKVVEQNGCDYSKSDCFNPETGEFDCDATKAEL